MEREGEGRGRVVSFTSPWTEAARCEKGSGEGVEGVRRPSEPLFGRPYSLDSKHTPLVSGSRASLRAQYPVAPGHRTGFFAGPDLRL